MLMSTLRMSPSVRNCTLRRHRSLDFNYSPGSQQEFPGAEQIEGLWRWISDLPANRDSATPIATLRDRATRLEQHDLRSNPAQWRIPNFVGETGFKFEDAPQKTFRWGLGASEFALSVSGCSDNSVYVYKDPIKAVGLIRGQEIDDADLARHLTPGRNVTPQIDESAVLMNAHGRLAVVEILDVQREHTSGSQYVPPFVDFRWRVVESS